MKQFKYIILMFRCYSDAIVFYTVNTAAHLSHTADPNNARSAWVGKFHRITDQIGENLRHLNRIALAVRQSANFYTNPSGAELELVGRCDATEQFLHIQRF